MFDDPGKKLHQLQDDLFSLEPEEDEEMQENLAVTFEDNLYEDDFDEDDAVLAEEPKRNRGAATLLVLVIAAVSAWAAARWLGWI